MIVPLFFKWAFSLIHVASEMWGFACLVWDLKRREKCKMSVMQKLKHLKTVCHGRRGSDEIHSVVDSIHSHDGSCRGISSRTCSLSTGCHEGRIWVSVWLCPNFKITPLLHSFLLPPLLVPLHRMAGSPRVWCVLYYVGARTRCRHIVRHPSRYWSELDWQGCPGYLQEKKLLFSFLVSISMWHL